MSNVFPREEEIPALVATPEWFLWRRASDARTMLGSGYALGLQVAHPTVGAGVSEFSDYAQDPFGRLFRTLDYLNVHIYGGPEAAPAMGRRVREMHKKIKGVDKFGRRYHALEPTAYAWVHATLAEAIVTANARFARPFTVPQRERFYTEWLRIGRLLGVREGDLPPTWREFRDYFDTMVADTLEATDALRDVLVTLQKPIAPPIPWLPDGAWRLARLPAARIFRLATVGMMPTTLRRRAGLRWTRANEAELRSLAAASRALTPVLPKSVTCFGPSYLAWREKGMEKGKVQQFGPREAPPPPRRIEAAA